MIFPIYRGFYLRQKLVLLLVFLSILLVSCTGKTTKNTDDPKTAERPIISYAKRLIIEKMDGYSQVSVLNPWQGARNIAQKIYLIPEGGIIPSFIDTSDVILVPVKKIVCMSTTHLSMISALDEERSVVGFSGTRFIYAIDLIRNVDKGDIREIGYDDNLNKEMILKLDPDLVMVYGIGSESAGYIAKLKEMGVKVVYNADYLETDPLGKAEWIKFMGALYSREAMADSIFGIIENEYNKLKSFISANITGRPSVMLGLPFKDTWYISPGNSYISTLIADAGGEYLWQNTESSVSMPTGLENVFLKALAADYWLNAGSANSLEEIVSIDKRLARLLSFKSGNVFNNNKRTNAGGGNDYWERGCLNPQIILKDIASILHPGLFPSAELYYYKKLNWDQH
jgi:iron complex transport system substrate-binding protein